MPDRIYMLGSLILPDGLLYHRADYPCAAWWQDIDVPAGSYPLYGYVLDSQVYGHKHPECIPFYYIGTHLRGTVVDCDFGGRIGGVPIGGTNKEHYVGRQGTAHVQWYAYEVAKHISITTSQWWYEVHMPWHYRWGKDIPLRLFLDPASVAFASYTSDHKLFLLPAPNARRVAA